MDQPFDPRALPVPELGLRCLGCGYALDHLPRRDCPECGHPIDLEDHIPRGGYPPLIVEGRAIKYRDGVDGLLDEHAIQHRPAESAATMMGMGMFEPSRANATLGVWRGDWLRALDVVYRHLHGLEQREPPEFTAADSPPWSCPECQEENPGNFGTCWNCGTRRDEEVV